MCVCTEACISFLLSKLNLSFSFSSSKLRRLACSKMADVETSETVKDIADAIAADPVEDAKDAGKVDESAKDDHTEFDEVEKEMTKMEEKPKVVAKLQILENKIVKSAPPMKNDVETALKQLQTMPVMVKGRQKKVATESDAANGKEGTPIFTSRNKLRRTFVTADELDKELEATMEELEPGSSVQITNNGSQGRAIQDQDLIAILEGNADVVTSEKKPGEVELQLLDVDDGAAEACEAEIALQQMMSMPKSKPGRKTKHEAAKHNSSNEVSSILDDWSDNEVEYEVTATESKTSNETTITISPASKGSSHSGASKRKQPQGLVADVPGTVEIIQTVEPPRILNAAKVASPIKFERRRVIKKKVIWDPDDPAPSPTRIGNTTIKKVAVVKKAAVPEKVAPVVEEKKPAVPVKRKRPGKSEIDKLLGDEGAVNMLYSVERENNSDLPDIKTAEEDQLIDVEEEQNNLLKKANALKRAVIKQTKSPPSTIPARAARAKPAPATTPTPPTTSSAVSPTSSNTTTANVTPAKKQTPAKKRKSNQNESWDYVYKARQNDDSMIVRRRSNSSYSSTTSPRRLSLDQSQLDDSAETPAETPPDVVIARPPTKKQRGKNFEFAKPSAKKTANKKPLDTSKLVEQIRGKLKPKPLNVTPTKVAMSPDSLKRLDSKQLSIKKYEKFAILILPTIDGKVKDCLTLQVSIKKILFSIQTLIVSFYSFSTK